jgi:hypothetical protein
MLVPAQQYVAGFLATFQEFPPRQKAASFSLEQIMEKMAVPNLNQCCSGTIQTSRRPTSDPAECDT